MRTLDLIFFYRRLIFWIEGKANSTSIKRSYSNGSGVVEVLSSSIDILDLCLDLIYEQLYWVTAEGCLCTSSFRGTGRHCFHCFVNEVPTGFSVFEVFIYVSLGTSSVVVQLQNINGNGQLTLY